MKASPPASAPLSVRSQLRALAGTWAIAAFMPLPLLIATDRPDAADIFCLYLGLFNAWLVTEFYRAWGTPETAAAWKVRMQAMATAVLVNVALFLGFGLAVEVQTHFPFPLMAVLSVLPAVGIMPWMLRRVPQHPYAAIVFAGTLVFLCKLAGCVVARFVYGPDYLAQGYAAGDWRTAKLMISLLWTFSTALSLGLLLKDYLHCQEKAPGPMTLNGLSSR